MLNLNEVGELRGWGRTNGALRLGSGLTYTEVMGGELASALPALAEASRSVGSPQIRNRGTDRQQPRDSLCPRGMRSAAAPDRGRRGRMRLPRGASVVVALAEFVTGVKRTVLAPDELISAVWVRPSGAAQTFMKVGPRNAMVIAVVSLALSAGEELRASFGSAGPRPVLVTAPRAEAGSFAERVAAAATPIDDVRGSAAYRRHALRVLTVRALERTAAA